MNRGRCSKHGLAIGPDGGCVLCRREGGSVAPDTGSSPSSPLPGVLSVPEGNAPVDPASSPSSSLRMSWTTPAAPGSGASPAVPSSKGAGNPSSQTGSGSAWVAQTGRYAAYRPAGARQTGSTDAKVPPGRSSSGSLAAVRTSGAAPPRGSESVEASPGPLAETHPEAEAASSNRPPSVRPRSSTPPPKQSIVSILPGDDGDEVVVRVPRGLVLAGAALVIAIGAFAWSRVTPDMSVFNNLFPAPATTPSDRASVPEPPVAPARAIEQAEPVRAEVPKAPAAEAPEVPPSTAARNEDPAELARRIQNQLEEKKERLALARRNVSITMYSTSWCKVCKDARRYLSEAGIPYDDYDVDSDRDADRRLRAVNPRHTVPTFDIDGAVLTGFSPGAIESMLTSAAARRAARE